MEKIKQRPLIDENNIEQYEIAQHFIKCYYSAREGLKRLGILRSERDLQGDYAEWVVAKFLGLSLADNTIQKGYDALDLEGRTYQVKGRISNRNKYRASWNFTDISHEFDFLICIFFDKNLEVTGILKVPRDVVIEHIVQNKRNFRFRWNIKTDSDARVEKIYWPELNEEY